ncbi:MAG: ribonuclease Z [archaeon]|nr:ribonuclease Z [archaeon]
MSDIKIHFLGTSSAIPTRERGLSCILLHYENELLFFDCGEGAQRTAITSGIGFNKDASIFISHMHGDHVVGLLGLLQTMAMQSRNKPLYVFGPKGVVEFLQLNQKLLNFGLTYPVYGKVVRRGVVFDSKKLRYRVLAEKSEHSTLSYAYLFQEKDKPGRFKPQSALKLGIPEGPLWSKLQSGQIVTSQKTKKKVKPEQVLGRSRPGKKIGISGDTRPTEELARFFHGCDVIVFDSTYGDEHSGNAKQNMHSTSREAAKLAKKAKAKRLILTHFSARYRDVRELVKQAKEIFPNTIAAEDNLVYSVL